ncbi:MAG: hypothetical protein ACYC1U_00195 [Candidatus Aquicultorales bacterium]
MRKVLLFALLVVLVAFVLPGCAADSNPNVNQAGPNGEVAGFWLGLWHGLIAPITFIVSLFKPNVNIYEVYNNGAWYNFGFLLGVAVLGGSGSSARRR